MAPPIRVLCVEDNWLVSDAIGRKLASCPEFEWLGSANNSTNFMEMVKTLHPTLVCMDLEIPGTDTIALIRSLRTSHPGLRVMMLSGHVSQSQVDAAIDAGAWGYLSKAEDSRDIVAAMREIAAGRFVLGKMVQQVVVVHPRSGAYSTVASAEESVSESQVTSVSRAQSRSWNAFRRLF